MTQSKRTRKTQPKGPEYQSAADSTDHSGPLWLHDEKLEGLVAQANPEGAVEAKQVLADARLVDQWILATGSAHHGLLAKYASAAWPDGVAVNRLNAALGLLQAGGRIHRVP